MRALPSRSAYLEVNTSQLKKKILENIRRHVHPAKVMVLLKANAYGHGVEGVAPYVAPLVDYIGVAIVDEGIRLRRWGSPPPLWFWVARCQRRCHCSSRNGAHHVGLVHGVAGRCAEGSGRGGARLKAHLKIDTGMERIGVRDYEAEAFLGRCHDVPRSGDRGDLHPFCELRSARPKPLSPPACTIGEVLAYFERRGVRPPPLRHAANSGAIIADA